MESNNKKRIGILRGGTGEYYASSLKRGGDIILHIFENLSHKYKPVDILIDRDHIWHVNGLPISPSDLIHKVDVVWNTTHPSYSNLLESLSIPNVGAQHFSSGLENSREMLREHIKGIGLSMPRHIVSPKNAREVFEKFGAPWIIKNWSGIKLAKTFNELAEAINNAENIIVEEFIAGKVASLHTLAGFRDSDVYTFPFGNTFGEFSTDEKEKLNNLVKNLRNHLGVKHYLKSDFVLNPRGKAYLLNIKLEPDLKPDSHFFQVCTSVGAKPHHVIEHILDSA